MLIEDESKSVEINPDALEAVFAEEILIEEEEIAPLGGLDERPDEIDIAFQANDEGYW
jgi:hypothetical protein